MVNRERMVEEFLELVRIDSLTFKEKEMAECLKAKLNNMGISVEEDDAGNKIGGNSGNLICKIDGNKNIPAILLMAHMDTVTPGIGKKPVVDGKFIRSDGSTILGGDDVAGIECILEAVRVLKEDKIPHGDIFIAFTVAEEGGLWGAKNLDISKINAKYAFVMDDGGNIGHVAVTAPAQNKIDIIITGKAAHAGMEPEKGISAIQIAAEAISGMKLGRIDAQTTANLGVINGGHATNIICDMIEIKAEARSCDMKKLEIQTEHMKDCFYKAAEKFGGKVVYKSELLYPSFSISEEDDIIKILKTASNKAGVKLMTEATGGGSDTNIINSKGIKAVDISVGMDKVHSVEEQICIDDLVKASEFLISIITTVA